MTVNDPNAYPSGIIFMSVFTFEYDIFDDFLCDPIADGLIALANWAGPETVPEDPEILGELKAICKPIDGDTS